MLNISQQQGKEICTVSFTNKLKEWRKKRGLTQSELAERSNVSRTTIAGIESGAIGTVTTDTILKLSSALNVSVPKIFLQNKFNVLNKKSS